MGKPIHPGEYPQASITGLLMGMDPDTFATQLTNTLFLDHEGIVGEPRQKRRGLLIGADVRTRGVRKGTMVPHQQHVSIIDEPSLKIIGDGLGIENDVTEEALGLSRMHFIAGCIGANIVVSRVELNGFYMVTNGTVMGRLDADGYFETAMQISRFNAPCINPGKVLQQNYPNAPENMAADFVEIAAECRGVVAGVYVAGSLSAGDVVSFVPKQTNWD